MDFDPALEAQIALQRSRASDELGARWEDAETLEETFSSSAGPEASEAYHQLLRLGHDYPDAFAFQEFLIYITWQQVTERTVAEYFQQGLRLAEGFLAKPSPRCTPQSLEQIRALHRSFQEGLGQRDQHELDEEFRRDRVKGGD